ncbi:hypothetical protein [Microscilla marina]|uniref:DUF4157 domain-containing protein n=1 Tax=Microscilla marina ATCC 23134 TaxID=313606 RepID=A1ZSG0_MICM2|nr:hypothetical protein [Microscilla marina]EAY26708.1 hypothetical protein M23134_02959 [Microscilla marina ATCC 23134]
MQEKINPESESQNQNQQALPKKQSQPKSKNQSPIWQYADGNTQEQTSSPPPSGETSAYATTQRKLGPIKTTQQPIKAKYSPFKAKQRPIERRRAYDKPHKSELPTTLAHNLEHLSGVSLEGTIVKENSAEPAQYGAQALAKNGQEIHLGPQAHHKLPEEAAHIAQQRLGKVQPNATLPGLGKVLNNDPLLEEEAQRWGKQAQTPHLLSTGKYQQLMEAHSAGQVMQFATFDLMRGANKGELGKQIIAQLSKQYLGVVGLANGVDELLVFALKECNVLAKLQGMMAMIQSHQEIIKTLTQWTKYVSKLTGAYNRAANIQKDHPVAVVLLEYIVSDFFYYSLRWFYGGNLSQKKFNQKLGLEEIATGNNKENNESNKKGLTPSNTALDRAMTMLTPFAEKVNKAIKCIEFALQFFNTETNENEPNTNSSKNLNFQNSHFEDQTYSKSKTKSKSESKTDNEKENNNPLANLNTQTAYDKAWEQVQQKFGIEASSLGAWLVEDLSFENLKLENLNKKTVGKMTALSGTGAIGLSMLAGTLGVLGSKNAHYLAGGGLLTAAVGTGIALLGQQQSQPKKESESKENNKQISSLLHTHGKGPKDTAFWLDIQRINLAKWEEHSKNQNKMVEKGGLAIGFGMGFKLFGKELFTSNTHEAAIDWKQGFVYKNNGRIKISEDLNFEGAFGIGEASVEKIAINNNGINKMSLVLKDVFFGKDGDLNLNEVSAEWDRQTGFTFKTEASAHIGGEDVTGMIEFGLNQKGNFNKGKFTLKAKGGIGIELIPGTLGVNLNEAAFSISKKGISGEIAGGVNLDTSVLEVNATNATLGYAGNKGGWYLKVNKITGKVIIPGEGDAVNFTASIALGNGKYKGELEANSGQAFDIVPGVLTVDSLKVGGSFDSKTNAWMLTLQADASAKPKGPLQKAGGKLDFNYNSRNSTASWQGKAQIGAMLTVGGGQINGNLELIAEKSGGSHHFVGALSLDVNKPIHILNNLLVLDAGQAKVAIDSNKGAYLLLKSSISSKVQGVEFSAQGAKLKYDGQNSPQNPWTVSVDGLAAKAAGIGVNFNGVNLDLNQQALTAKSILLSLDNYNQNNNKSLEKLFGGNQIVQTIQKMAKVKASAKLSGVTISPKGFTYDTHDLTFQKFRGELMGFVLEVDFGNDDDERQEDPKAYLGGHIKKSLDLFAIDINVPIPAAAGAASIYGGIEVSLDMSLLARLAATYNKGASNKQKTSFQIEGEADLQALLKLDAHLGAEIGQGYLASVAGELFAALGIDTHAKVMLNFGVAYSAHNKKLELDKNLEMYFDTGFDVNLELGGRLLFKLLGMRFPFYSYTFGKWNLGEGKLLAEYDQGNKDNKGFGSWKVDKTLQLGGKDLLEGNKPAYKPNEEEAKKTGVRDWEVDEKKDKDSNKNENEHLSEKYLKLREIFKEQTKEYEKNKNNENSLQNESSPENTVNEAAEGVLSELEDSLKELFYQAVWNRLKQDKVAPMGLNKNNTNIDIETEIKDENELNDEEPTNNMLNIDTNQSYLKLEKTFSPQKDDLLNSNNQSLLKENKKEWEGLEEDINEFLRMATKVNLLGKYTEEAIKLYSEKRKNKAHRFKSKMQKLLSKDPNNLHRFRIWENLQQKENEDETGFVKLVNEWLQEATIDALDDWHKKQDQAQPKGETLENTKVDHAKKFEEWQKDKEGYHKQSKQSISPQFLLFLPRESKSPNINPNQGSTNLLNPMSMSTLMAMRFLNRNRQHSSQVLNKHLQSQQNIPSLNRNNSQVTLHNQGQSNRGQFNLGHLAPNIVQNLLARLRQQNNSNDDIFGSLFNQQGQGSQNNSQLVQQSNQMPNQSRNQMTLMMMFITRQDSFNQLKNSISNVNRSSFANNATLNINLNGFVFNFASFQEFIAFHRSVMQLEQRSTNTKE